MTDNLLTFSADLDRNILQANQSSSELSCRVNIEPNVADNDTSKITTTANICLLFDCSYSMRGNNFKTAISTAKMIVDILHERHWISLLAFQSRSYTVFENEVPSDQNKEPLKNLIDKLTNHLGGSTNMAAGIENAMDVLSKSEADSDLIIILSDGEADHIEKAQTAADEASRNGIQIYAVGIGESYNAAHLLRLVTPSNGAVYGDSEGDNIGNIFYNIINRIDRIYVSKAIIDFSFDKSVDLKQVYRTSPERALYDSLALDDDHKLELRVGNIENDKIYEFLLQIEVGQHDACTLELIKARLHYEVNQSGMAREQVQELILTVNFTENKSADSITDKNISRSIKKATMLQLCNDLVKAFSESNNTLALQIINELQQKCTEENNTALHLKLDNIRTKLENGDRVSDKERNDFLLDCSGASPEFVVEPVTEVEPEIVAEPEIEIEPEIIVEPDTVVEPEVKPLPIVEAVPQPKAPSKADTQADIQLYYFTLVEPGNETIRLIREIRNATKLGIPEIANIIKTKNCLITAFKNKNDADNLQQRLIRIGAKVRVDVSTEAENT